MTTGSGWRPRSLLEKTELILWSCNIGSCPRSTRSASCHSIGQAHLGFLLAGWATGLRTTQAGRLFGADRVGKTAHRDVEQSRLIANRLREIFVHAAHLGGRRAGARPAQA